MLVNTSAQRLAMLLGCITLLVLHCLSLGCQEDTCITYTAPPDSIINEHRLPDHVITEMNGSAAECLDACALDCSCTSFNLIGSRWCQLNYEDNDGVGLVYDVTASYHSIEITTHSSAVSCGCNNMCCLGSPCKNGGQCTEICDHKQKRFHCTCPTGFTGRLCQTNIDDCVPDACGDWGTCVDGVNTFTCLCSPGFTGQHCQTALATSCSDLKRLGNNQNKTYLIDPDGWNGEPAIIVHCDMTDHGGVGVTEVSHDSEARTEVNDPSCSDAGCYSRNVTYLDVTMTQVIKLIEISKNCEQFIKYECLGSGLLYKKPPTGWWVSRDHGKMKYWGGATRESGKCACGMTEACDQPDRPCNCDTPDGKWHEDSGFLIYKEDLPVMQLRFGDVDMQDEMGYHTLGKLRCYGLKDT